MKKLIFLFAALIQLSISSNGQGVSLPANMSLNSSDFGTIVNIPIHVTSFPESIAVVIQLTYDDCALTFEGVTNLFDFGSSSPVAIYVNEYNSGIINIDIYDVVNATAFTLGTSKLLDLRFTFNGGLSDLSFVYAKYMDVSSVEHDATMTNGSVSGFATLTSNPAGGDWSSTSAWIGNFGALTEPGPGHNITIQSGGTITINTAEAKANSITVASGGQLTQQSGNLNLVDFLKISSGGSFIQNGTITCGDVSVDRYIAGGTWTTSNDGWHMLSSPMTTQAINGSFTPDPSTSYDFYGWDEAAQTWRNFKGPNFAGWNGGTNFIPGRGYLVAYQNTDTKTFAGTLNSNNVSIPVVRGGSDVYVGYNLVGNPYPSAISWNTGDWSLGNIGGVAHVWDRTAKAYVELDSPGDLIPAMNGFMVYLSNSATTSLTIPKAARTHGGTNWYKSTDERIVLLAHSPSDGSAQRTVIRFNADATEDFDLAHDGYFLQGYAPKFYSKSNNLMFSVNTLPGIIPDMEIPLGFEKTTANEFYIELAETLSNEVLYLTDNKTNTTVILSPGAHYQFTAEEGDSPDRFLIHFNPVGNTEITQPKPMVFAKGENLVVRDLKTKTLVELYNQLGQRVYNGKTDGIGMQEIGLSLPEGVYIVRLSNGIQTTSTKVFLQ